MTYITASDGRRFEARTWNWRLVAALLIDVAVWGALIMSGVALVSKSLV